MFLREVNSLIDLVYSLSSSINLGVILVVQTMLKYAHNNMKHYAIVLHTVRDQVTKETLASLLCVQRGK